MNFCLNLKEKKVEHQTSVRLSPNVLVLITKIVNGEHKIKDIEPQGRKTDTFWTNKMLYDFYKNYITLTWAWIAFLISTWDLWKIETDHTWYYVLKCFSWDSESFPLENLHRFLQKNTSNNEDDDSYENISYKKNTIEILGHKKGNGFIFGQIKLHVYQYT